MPDDQQLSESEGGSGGSVSDAERMSEESEVGQLILIFIFIFRYLDLYFIQGRIKFPDIHILIFQKNMTSLSIDT